MRLLTLLTSPFGTGAGAETAHPRPATPGVLGMDVGDVTLSLPPSAFDTTGLRPAPRPSLWPAFRETVPVVRLAPKVGALPVVASPLAEDTWGRPPPTGPDTRLALPAGARLAPGPGLAFGLAVRRAGLPRVPVPTAPRPQGVSRDTLVAEVAVRRPRPTSLLLKVGLGVVPPAFGLAPAASGMARRLIYSSALWSASAAKL